MLTPNPSTWLVLAVGDDRQHGGNDGYDDEPSSHYSWDDTVPNHGRVSVGDAIVLWDKESLIGVSIIEEIAVQTASKFVYRCPKCGLAGIKLRKAKVPAFKCYKCKHEFVEPDRELVEVTTYRSLHDAGWVHLPGRLSGPVLRSLCESPKSQLSLRPLRWTDFRGALDRALVAEDRMTAFERRWTPVKGGHLERTVRVRLGQAEFRKRLVHEFGAVCALTGPAPLQALEAGHLYSYAELGTHEKQGGLLLRRDIHRLFDHGHLAVNPHDLTLDVSSEVAKFPAYGALHGTKLQVSPLSMVRKNWLLAHWDQHRH